MSLLAILTVDLDSLIKTGDCAILSLVFLALLLGSVIYVVKSFRSHDEHGAPTIGYGQLSILPRRWQLWIFDERDENEPKHR
jgi:hypothetical protein